MRRARCRLEAVNCRSGYSLSMDIEESSFNPLGRLRALLPVLLLLLIIMGNGLYAFRFLVPSLNAYEAARGRVEDAQALLSQPTAEPDTLEVDVLLPRQIATAEAERAQSLTVFLTTEQVDAMLGQIFVYAAASAVEIRAVQAQQPAEAAETERFRTYAFRLQVAGEMRGLLEFAVRTREATVPGLRIQNVDLRAGAGESILVMEMVLTASPYALGLAFDEAYTIDFPHNLDAETEPLLAPVEVAESSVQPADQTTITYLANQPPLSLLYTETFDSNTLYAWSVTPGWTLAREGDNGILRTERPLAPMTFVHRTLFSAAAQIRFRTQDAALQLRVRESEAGYYAVVVDGAQIALYRGTVLVESADLLPPSADGWRTLRLVAVDDLVSVVLDDREYIAIRDLARLPPGTVAFSMLRGGSVTVDEVTLWSSRTGQD